MGGLLWTAVTAGEIDPPVSVTRALAKLDMATVNHHQRLWSTISVATEKLNAEGISSVVFKGVTDEARWFKRLGERPCSDVDLIITDINRFDDAIKTLVPDHPLIGSAADAARRGLLRAVDLKVDGVLIDLHVDPVKVGSGWRNASRWFEHTQPFDTPSGDSITVFDDQATATLRLIHLGRDRFRYLIWLLEVHAILATIDGWDGVIDLAGSEGLSAPVEVAAEVVREEVGAGPDSRCRDWRCRLWRRMWRPETRLLGELARKRFVRRSSWLLPMTMPGRTWESLRWLARTAVPPAVVFDLKHPGGRGPYLWRLMAGRAGYLVRRRLHARAERRN